MQNGVLLAKLAHFIAPEQIKLKKIFDLDLCRYEVSLYMSSQSGGEMVKAKCAFNYLCGEGGTHIRNLTRCSR